MSHDLVVRLDGEPVTGVDDMIRLLDRNRIGKRGRRSTCCGSAGCASSM